MLRKTKRRICQEIQEWDEEAEDPTKDNPELGWGFLEDKPKDGVVPGQVMTYFIIMLFFHHFSPPALKYMDILFPTCRLLSIRLDARS